MHRVQCLRVLAVASVSSLMAAAACGGSDDVSVDRRCESDCVDAGHDGGNVDAHDGTDATATNDGARPVDGASDGSADGASDGGADGAQSSDAADAADVAVDACNSTSPVKVQKVVNAFDKSVCSLDDQGVVRCSGDAWVKDPGTQVVSFVTNALATPTVMNGLNGDVIDIAAGYRYFCALKSNGDVLCWGQNDLGQLGDPAETGAARAEPAVVPSLGTAKVLSIGYAHACVVLDDKHARCWGENANKQLGKAAVSGAFSATPLDVDTVTTAVDVKSSEFGSCTRNEDQSLHCWGGNVVGAGVSSGVADFRLGSYGGCALTTTNTLKCWGESRAGTYTAQTLTDAQDVPGLSAGFKSFRVNAYGACVLMNAGGVKCWGLFYGGRTPAKEYLAMPSTPMDMTSMGTNITDIRFPNAASVGVSGYDATTQSFVTVSTDYSGHTETAALTHVAVKSPTPCGSVPFLGLRYWSDPDLRSNVVVDLGYNIIVASQL